MGRKAKVEEKVEKVPRILKKNNVKSKMNFTHVKTEYEPNTVLFGANSDMFVPGCTAFRKNSTNSGMFGGSSINSNNSNLFGGSSTNNSNLLFGRNSNPSTAFGPSAIFGNSNTSNVFGENSNTGTFGRNSIDPSVPSSDMFGNPPSTLFGNTVKPISTFNVGPYKLGIFQMF